MARGRASRRAVTEKNERSELRDTNPTHPYSFSAAPVVEREFIDFRLFCNWGHGKESIINVHADNQYFSIGFNDRWQIDRFIARGRESSPIHFTPFEAVARNRLLRNIQIIDYSP